MAQRVLRVVELQVDPEVLVVQVELAPVAVVAVLDPDDRLAEVGQAEQQPLLDLLELAALSREFKKIKERLLFSLTNFGQPIIRVKDGNYRNRGELYLYHEHFGVDLKLDHAQ